jgi:hypothetical protein
MATAPIVDKSGRRSTSTSAADGPIGMGHGTSARPLAAVAAWRSPHALPPPAGRTVMRGVRRVKLPPQVGNMVAHDSDQLPSLVASFIEQIDVVEPRRKAGEIGCSERIVTTMPTSCGLVRRYGYRWCGCDGL